MKHLLVAVALVSCTPTAGGHAVCHIGHEDCGASALAEIRTAFLVDTARGFVSVQGPRATYIRASDGTRVVNTGAATIAPLSRNRAKP